MIISNRKKLVKLEYIKHHFSKKTIRIAINQTLIYKRNFYQIINYLRASKNKMSDEYTI